MNARPRLPRFYVYLLLSDRGEVYAGFTSCIKRRLAEHNAPDNTGWTRGRRWYLLAIRTFLDRPTALLAERHIKRSRHAKQAWIKSHQNRLQSLIRRHNIASP